MKPWVKDPAFSILRAVVLLAVTTLGCSAPPQSDINAHGAEPATPDDEEPFDPLKPGASIICDVPAENGVRAHVVIHVLSAMNHKLAWYPDFAAAVGLQQVTECEGANRYRKAYAEYVREHPGFDADEPLPPMSEEEPPELEYAENAPDPEVSKIGGVNQPSGVVDNAVVRIEFETCNKGRPGDPNCARADDSWIVHPGTPDEEDLRGQGTSCTGTFISKNWILTAAHCITFAAIDSCLEKGTKRQDCHPRWDNRKNWKISGFYAKGRAADGTPLPGSIEYTDEVVQMRSYVISSWDGDTIDKNPITCDTPGCDADIPHLADHDLALLYVDRRENHKLPPRLEDDAAKRLSIVLPQIGPTSTWTFAAMGWGDPRGSGDRRVLRHAFVPRATLSLPAGAPNRIRVDTPSGDGYFCRGDSGGPMLRNGLSLQTNRGFVRNNLEAIIAVMSSGTGKCKTGVEEVFPVRWHGTLVHTFDHLKFIHETMRRWPWNVQTCIEKELEPKTGRTEVEECWAKPCTLDSQCSMTEECVGSPLDVLDDLPASESMCKVCSQFPAGNTPGLPDNALCNCMEGQCLPKK